jgi:hypothetical protein
MANILLVIDATVQEVTTRLRAIGSTDPDILYAAKTELSRAFVHQKAGGIALAAVGVLMTLTMFLAPVGIPVIAAGVWCWRRGIHNLEVVETAHQAFLSATRRTSRPDVAGKK